MVSLYMRWPDVARVLVADLEVLAGAGHTGGETPVDLAGRLPFIRVLRVGGGADQINDYPAVDVDVFAGSYTAGEALAEAVRQRIVGPPPAAFMLDRAVCEVGPRELPWGTADDGVRRFGATYLITVRRRVTT